MPKVKLAILASVLVGLFVLPSVASAACSLPTTPVGTGHSLDDLIDPADSVIKSGNFKPEMRGKFVQIPFDVPAGTTGIRVRYCYDEAAPNPGNINNTTLDLGVYQPNAADPEKWTMAQRRGWSGSAVKMIGIGENGPTDKATYNLHRKAYVPGRTSRAYSPGPISAGEWAVELGAGYIDPALTSGADWKVELTFSDDAGWSNDQYVPHPYVPNVANPAAGWYQGDLHVHGENEPGNAPMDDSFDLAFGPDGVGLDFLTLVDHNNDVARSEIGAFENEYPGKLIVPGTEMTTYDGHFNSQNSNEFVDFRLGAIYRFDDTNTNNLLDDGELTSVRGPEDPSDRFAKIGAAGGWAQINHPTIWQSAPALCRGCAWNYDDARTDFSTVNAIELQTGPAGIPAYDPATMNPFTQPAIDYYEHALATGAHIAAVGSSDDHQATSVDSLVPGPDDASASTLGTGATVVHATQLSQAAITAAIKAGHTYVKPFGPDAPDVELSATAPGQAAVIPGDSMTGESLDISVKVTGADSGVRPGPYTLMILKDGKKVESVPVTGGSFTHSFEATTTGRYSFELTRLQTNMNGTAVMIEAYSTPVWFTYEAGPAPTCETDPSLCPAPKPSNKFSFGGLKLNKKKGTAQLKVKVANPGTVKLSGKDIAGATAKPKKKNQVVTLTIKAKGKLKKTLKKKGSAKAKAKVTYTPTGGKAASKSKTVKLKLAKKGKKH